MKGCFSTVLSIICLETSPYAAVSKKPTTETVSIVTDGLEGHIEVLLLISILNMVTI